MQTETVILRARRDGHEIRFKKANIRGLDGVHGRTHDAFARAAMLEAARRSPTSTSLQMYFPDGQIEIRSLIPH